jgi:homoserine acetyltransferase
MRFIQRSSWLVVSAAVLAVVLVGSHVGRSADPITATSGVPELASLKKFHSIPNFAIGGEYEIGNEAAYESGGKGGVTLESLGHKPLQVAYIDVGTPQKDTNGKIINAVIISTYYSGDATFGYFYWYDGQKGNEFSQGAVVGPGKLIDTNKFYVVFLDALGLWGASKPSDGLGLDFPRYSYFDYVQANYRLLKDKLGIGKVKLATGVSMGGAQSYLWAVMHPDFVEAIMPIGGFSAMDPVTRWMFRLMSAAMQSDPAWRDTEGDYYALPKDQHPNKGMMFGWSILGQTGLSFDLRAKQPWDAVKKEVFFWEPKDDEGSNLVPKAKDFDVNDLLLRNMAGDPYNINDHLQRIKAKTLILHVKNDQWLRYIMAEETAKKIVGAKLVGFENPFAHYAIFRAPNILKDEVTAFFKEIGMQ